MRAQVVGADRKESGNSSALRRYEVDEMMDIGSQQEERRGPEAKVLAIAQSLCSVQDSLHLILDHLPASQSV